MLALVNAGLTLGFHLHDLFWRWGVWCLNLPIRKWLYNLSTNILSIEMINTRHISFCNCTAMRVACSSNMPCMKSVNYVLGCQLVIPILSIGTPIVFPYLTTTHSKRRDDTIYVVVLTTRLKPRVALRLLWRMF